MLERGVYLAPFVSRRGHAVWLAVDSRGHCLEQLEVTAWRPEWRVREELAAVLETYEPCEPPRLAVIRGGSDHA